MKKVLWFCVALLVAPASASFAGVDLSWDNCPSPAGGEPAPTFDKTFACTGGSTYKLMGTFKVPSNMPDFFAMDVSIDMQQSNNAALVPFYRYEVGGCNNDALAIHDEKNLIAGTCALFSTPWGPAGTASTAAITAFGPNYLGQNGRGRLLVTIARPSASPFVLNAGTNYYAFHFDFFDFNAAPAGACAGCNQPAVLVWNSATMFGVSETRVITGPTPKTTQYCATIGSGTSGLGVCAATPTKNSTWGQLKSIYR